MASLDAAESPAPPRGEVRFVEASALSQLRGAAQAASLLFAEIPALGPSARGQLAEFLEAAVEEVLVRRGGAPPGVGVASDWSASLADQLYRASRLGLRGLVLTVGPLQGAAGPGGVLDPDDSAALRFWARASRESPVIVLIDQRNRALSGHGPPTPIEQLLGAPPAEATEAESSSLEGGEAERTHPHPGVGPALAAERAKEESSAWVDSGEWRRFAEELHAARGPKPLAVVERMFTTRYAALAEAEMRGCTDAFARQVRADWAANFARSYGEAFAALRVTGKRPSETDDSEGIVDLELDGVNFDGTVISRGSASVILPRRSAEQR